MVEDTQGLVVLGREALHTLIGKPGSLNDVVTQLLADTQIMRAASLSASRSNDADQLWDCALIDAFDTIRALNTTELDALSDQPGFNPFIYGAIRDAHERASIRENLTTSRNTLNAVTTSLTRSPQQSARPATHTPRTPKL